MRRLFLAAALLLAVAPAQACLNDRELPEHEREFRSQYGTQFVHKPKRSSSPLSPTTLEVLRWSGVAALASAGLGILLGGRNRG